ncbi:MAG: response regulator transcription factor [Bacteroidetes bacterium]|nr:response regulator transcription factor [Bacteroidota bacterium]
MIKAIIVDDEEKCRITLKRQIQEHCPAVSIEALCDSALSAEKALIKYNPDLVFLDIEMPFKDGFSFLEKHNNASFRVIFTTAYNHYAIKAIRFAALDYLLKPIDADELILAVGRFKKEIRNEQSLELLLANIKSNSSSRLGIPTLEGLQMVEVKTISKCVAYDCYTELILNNGKQMVASRLLKDFEEILSEYNFLRIHHSYIINLNEVNRYVKGEGGYVVMNDGSTCEVSRRKKAELMRKLVQV